MAHQIDMVMDFQYGSTGKGAIVGYLAKRENYDTAVCSFGTQAGHTYIDKARGIHAMVQQLPVAAIASETVKNVLIGPGSLIHLNTLTGEFARYGHLIGSKRVMIHEHAAIVEDYHTQQEIDWGMTKIGSTAHGVGAAAIERIKRSPDNANVAKVRFRGTSMEQYVVTGAEYIKVLNEAQSIIIEGAQGFSLSMYHGQYPYTTSRDVTPWQIAADCGLPYKWASYIKVIGSMRTFPIRVNNRDGSSGPCYPDQMELDWNHFGIPAELTTVTKLPRRIFTFSREQLEQAMFHCGGYWDTRVFLNFANYCKHPYELSSIIKAIETSTAAMLKPPRVAWIGGGADDSEIEVYQEKRMTW